MATGKNFFTSHEAKKLVNTYGGTTQPVYINGGVPTNTTYTLGSTVSAGTASRIAYFSGANAVSAGTVITDGSYFRFNKSADGALLQNTYSSTAYNLIRNHNNGNISISASSQGLYLGYENTSFINLLNGKGQQTSNGQFSISSTVAGNAGIINLSQSGSSAGTYWGVNHLAPNLPTGSRTVLLTGVANNSKNQAYIGFYYAGSGSNDNFLTLGFYNADNLTRLYANGKMAIGGSYKLSDTWYQGSTAIGVDGYDKAVIGYLPSSTNGAVFGAHNSTLTAWAPVNLCGTEIYFRQSETLVGKFIKGTLNIIPNGGSSYDHGLRIRSVGNWSGIMLCGNDLTADTGTSANSWWIGNNNGNFYLCRNGSTSGSAILKCVSNVWSWNGTASGSISGNAATATTATTANRVLTASHPGVNPTYGANYLEYFNASISAGAAANTTGSPTSDWYHHIRMNHGNSNGYYVDIAACFHNDNIYWKRVSSGSVANGKWMHIWVEGNAVTSAVWNDYAEYRQADTIEAGRCVSEVGDDSMELSTKRLQKGCSITSDTWGFAQGETDKAKTPIAVSGRVLAYPYEDREEFRNHIGDAVCSGPEGTVSIMTDEEVIKYPLAIIGTISAVPDYEEWGGGTEVDRGPVKVNGRIWIRIK